MIKCSEAFGKIIERRKRYFTPNEIEAINVAHGKLILLEEMEKRERLIILPCKVGDTVYFIFKDKVYSGLILYVNLSKGFETQNITMYVKYSIRGRVLIDAEEIGKTVFFTREEAESALKNSIEKEN